MNIKPQSREELFLAALAGENVTLPDPVSRLEKLYAAILRNDSFGDSASVEEAKQAAQEAVNYVNETFQNLNNLSETLNYGTNHGKIVLINGAFPECSVRVSEEFAGQTVCLTHISNAGETTEEYVIQTDGLVFAYLNLADGYNLITVTQTNPSGKLLPADDVINCVVRYKYNGAVEPATDWSDFLTAHNLSLTYVPVDAPKDFTSDAYFIREYCDNSNIWPELNSSDGYYYKRIFDAPADSNTQIYTWSLARILDG